MKQSAKDRSKSRRTLVGALVVGAVMMTPMIARADEGGVSMWVPGLFGSLAATPVQPGFSFAGIYYHTSVSAGGDVAFARQVSAGRVTTNFTGNLNANLDANVDLGIAIPSYTFEQRFLGAQATVLMLVPYGRAKASVDATLTGNLGLGGPGFTIGRPYRRDYRICRPWTAVQSALERRRQ